MYIKNQTLGNKAEFIAQSTADIATLPTSTEVGTGGKNAGDNDKIALGSTCMVVTGSATDVYILGPANTWTKM